MKKAVTIWVLKGGISGERKIVDAVAATKNAGFDALEVSMDKKGEISINTSVSEVKKIRREVKDAGGTLSSISSLLFNEVSLASNDAEEREYAKTIAIKMLETADALEIPTVSLSPGKVTPENDYKSVYERALSQISNLAGKARELGVALCLENVWQGFLLSPLEFAAFLDTVGNPAVGACFDTGNTMLTGYPHHWVNILHKRIYKIHITNIRRRMGTLLEFVCPGKGDIDWISTMHSIRTTGYKGYLTIEAFYKKNREEEDYLKELENSFHILLKDSQEE